MMVHSLKQTASKGRLIVLSSPSGGGKNTIISRLIQRNQNFVHSISVTTRSIRPGEEDGNPYCFSTVEKFSKMRDRGEFLEWEEVHGNYYGTPGKPVEEALSKGLDVLFDLDVKGALKLKKSHPEVLIIFLMPPSIKILEERLRKRGSEDEKQLQARLKVAKWECEQAKQFDHIIINDDLKSAVKAVEQIVTNPNH